MKSDNNYQKLLFTYFIFAVAMAYLEAVVVVYLRLLYYPQGFRFPLADIPAYVALTEIGRETATIIMLWFVARMGRRDFKGRFALFIYSFGVWDIFYYVWLKVLLNWPHGWLVWDILFLIPLPWVAPWLAPFIVSIGLIFTARLILKYPEKFPKKILSQKEWILEAGAIAAILISFFWESLNVLQKRIPESYPWWLFTSGFLSGIIVIIRCYRRTQ